MGNSWLIYPQTSTKWLNNYNEEKRINNQFKFTEDRRSKAYKVKILYNFVLLKYKKYSIF